MNIINASTFVVPRNILDLEVLTFENPINAIGFDNVICSGAGNDQLCLFWLQVHRLVFLVGDPGFYNVDQQVHHQQRIQNTQQEKNQQENQEKKEKAIQREMTKIHIKGQRIQFQEKQERQENRKSEKANQQKRIQRKQSNYQQRYK